ncbi:HalOD1 output domain-containing protein [Halorubrum sp. N11]|uniref:HalOD1 output domain-containing protein n=1 Tax=Halorubrum sp. N11 TaxID=3402276 RepID=UPI003EB72768
MTFDNASPTEGTETGDSSETVQTAWDGSNAPSTAVIEAVAAAKGQDAIEMPPLYDAFDVDALDNLLTSGGTAVEGNIAVSFRYNGTYIWVDSGGMIEVDPDEAQSE